MPTLTLAGQPPMEKRGKGRVQQPDIETENDYTTSDGCPGGKRPVHKGTHDIATARKHHQCNDRERKHKAEHYLADDERLRGIEAQQDNQDGRNHRDKTPHPDGDSEAHADMVCSNIAIRLAKAMTQSKL